MMNDGIENQVRGILQSIPERLRIAEEGISSSVAQEYMRYSEKLDMEHFSGHEIVIRNQNLFSPNTPLEVKKETLAILAHEGTVASYRTIEKYLEVAEQELKDWSLLSLQECRMFLENSLLDQNIGMIMTGLGGQNNRLRYFIVIRSRNDIAFTTTQKAIVERAFSDICSSCDSIMEEIHVHRDHVTMKLSIPLDIALAEVIEGGIDECNTADYFVDPYYYSTNVAIPEEAEILQYLREIPRDVE